MAATATIASTGVSGPRELLSGVDSLDLTCKTPAPAGLLEHLAILKDEAGGDARRAVVLPIGDDHLRVAASGMGAWWPFRLEHRFGQLGIGCAANRPAWRVSAAAEALHVQGVARVVEFWRSIIEALTGTPALLMASRLDVHADFAGLGVGDEDRPAFVCRSRRQSAEDALSRAGAVYLYAVTKWLRLLVPGSDRNRARWAVDARWQAVQAASIGAGLDALRRVEPERQTPGLDVIVANAAGWALRAGESLGVDDLATLWRQLGLLVGAHFEDKGRDFQAEVRARRLELMA